MQKHVRAALALLCGLMMVACGSIGPSAESQPSTAAQASTVATERPTLDLPTPAPRITAAPTATAFPLQTGWWDNAVCYEIFVRSFYDSDGDGIGDFNGLTAKLDYINDGDPATQTDLGANCIWLMPIQEASSYHGYDVVDYYAIEQDYGTTEDFKRFVDEAHGRGIRIVMDLVLNHVGVEHPWFQEAARDPDSPYRDWFLWSNDRPPYLGPWGEPAWHQSPARDEYYYGIFWSGMPDLNYRNPAVTAEAHKVSEYWLNDMGVDGFRLDAIKHLIENGSAQENTLETHAWLREYRAFLQQTKPDAWTIGEIFGATPSTLAPYYPDQLDFYFEFDVGQKLIATTNYGLTAQFTNALRTANASIPYQRWAPFLTNHDQERVMSTLGDDVNEARIAATALLTLPGLPFVYYGEEIGMLGTKPDEYIRTPMQWSGEANAGFSTGTPHEILQRNYKQVNVAAQDSDPNSLLNLYRRLINLHTANPALGSGDLTLLEASNAQVVAHLRQNGDRAVLVLLNFGKQPAANVGVASEASGLAAGQYQLQPLLGDQPGAPLDVADGGSFDATPLPELAPQTGYIFELTR
jgi:alpha-amylase